MSLVLSLTVKKIGNGGSLTNTRTRVFNTGRMDRIRLVNTNDTEFRYKRNDDTVMYTVDESYSGLSFNYNPGVKFTFTEVEPINGTTTDKEMLVDDILYMWADPSDPSTYSWVEYYGYGGKNIEKIKVSGALATLVTNINESDDVTMDDLTLTGDLSVAGDTTLTGTLDVTGDVELDGAFVVSEDDAGAVGADGELYHNSASPAINDQVGIQKFSGNDDGGNKTIYAEVVGSIVDPTDGAEIGDVQALVQNGTGSLAQACNLSHDGSYGIVGAGDGSATGVFESVGDNDVTLRTGNSTTGNVTITDGANGDIIIDADGNGKINTRGTEVYDKARFDLMEDFVMPTINETDFPVILNNDGGGGADPSIAANAAGGVLTCDTSGGGGANGSQIVMSIPFSADKGNLVFETSLHINTAIAGCRVVAGITDNAAWELPATIAAGDVITTNASDACVFVYDDQADTDEWFAVGVAGDTDATGNGTTSTAPVADTYQTLRIEVAADGSTASFYIGGALVGSLTANAITAATTVYATVLIQESAAAAKTVDVDYIYVGHTR